jgi:hypothetical protein
MYLKLFELNKKKYEKVAEKLFIEKQKLYPGGSSLDSYKFITAFLNILYKEIAYKDLKSLITDCSSDGGIDAFYFGKEHIDIFDFKVSKGISDIDLDRIKLSLEKYLSSGKKDFTGDESIKSNIKKILLNKKKKIRLIIARAEHKYSKKDLLEGKQGSKKILNIISYLEKKLNIEVLFEDSTSIFLKKFDTETVTGIVTLNVQKDLFAQNTRGAKDVIAKISLETIFTKLVEKYGVKIISSNVRGHLNKKPFSEKIVKTLKTSPEKFYIFHNGITVTCSKIETCEPTPVSITIQNPQIVNGAQSIFGLFNAYKDKILSNKDIRKSFLVCKIIEADNEFSKKICETSNTQNAVKSEDLRSNDEIQVFLEEYLSIVSDGKISYKRKKGGISKKGSVTSVQLFQWVCAALLQEPAAAKNEKQFLFDIVTSKGMYKNIEKIIKEKLDDILPLCKTAFFVQEQIRKNKSDKKRQGLLKIMEFYLIARLFMLNSFNVGDFDTIYNKLKKYADSKIKEDDTKNYSKIFNQSTDAWKFLIS